jgi:hypothetical protein
VKFADDHGLPLAAVKEFKRFDYFESLREAILENSLSDPKFVSSSSATSRPPSPPLPHIQAPAPAKFVCDFLVPSHDYAHFEDKVKRGMVSLERIYLSDNRVSGLVRVLNFVFEKRVFIRYTTDHWKTTREVECNYVDKGLHGSTSKMDSFSFVLDLQELSPIQPDHEVQFCIRFEAGNQHHWDNNNGKNYSIVTAESVRLRDNIREEEEWTVFRFDL